MMNVSEKQAILEKECSCFGCESKLEKGRQVEYRRLLIKGVYYANYFCATCVAVAKQRGWDLGKQKFEGSIKNTNPEFWQETYIITEGSLSRYQNISKRDFKNLVRKKKHGFVWMQSVISKVKGESL